MIQHIYENECFGEQWFTYPNVYRLMVDKCEPSGTIVELGAWKGRSSAFLVVEAKNKSQNINIQIVDTWLGSEEHTEEMKDNLYQKFKSNMAGLDGLYKEHRMKTSEAVHLFDDKSLDGVFIDADHSYESVKKDIADWLPKIKTGGIIAGHDYIQTFDGVIRAVNESFLNMDFMLGEQCWIKQC